MKAEKAIGIGWEAIMKMKFNQFVKMQAVWARAAFCVNMVFLAAAAMTLASSVAMAATITGVQLESKGTEQVVRINLDDAGKYQVYDLEGPSRVAVSLPGYALSKGITAMKGNGGVENVFPVQDENGARVEIGLTAGATYKVNEEGNALIVSITDASGQGTQATGAEIKDLQVKDRGSYTEVVVSGEHMDANHNAFVTNGGSSIILDFWGAVSKLPKEFFSYSTQKVSGVTVGAADDRVRLVLSLVPGADVKHQIDADANRLVVRIGNVVPKHNAAGVVVEAVDFKPDDRIAHLVIRTSETNPIVNLNEKDGKVIIDLKNGMLASGQERSQDVSAFPGPVKQVDSYSLDKGVRIVARLRQKVELSSFQAGNILTINMIPEDIARTQAGAEGSSSGFAYNGQKVTFDFKDIDIANAIKLIAEMSDLNIIMGDDVKGTLSMRLIDVPWDQALDLILQARGLGKEQMGNVVRIAPLEVLATEHENKLKAQKTQFALDPLITELVTTNFASAKDIVKTIKEQSKASEGKQGGAAQGETESSSANGLLSSRGSILADERTNTIIITDTETAINNIKRLIAGIDKPAEQVLIEARIVEATDNFSRDIGVRWGGYATRTTSKYTHAISNTSSATPPGGFLVDLPAAAGAGAGGTIGYALGAVSGSFNLNLELSAAEAEGQIKVVSNPRVIATNNTPAEISQGEDIPFQSTSANAGTSIQFKQAKLGLLVTPQVTPERGIVLQVEVSKDTPRANDLQAGGAPIIGTKKINTSIFMDNGETVVIGGIYTRNESTTENGVPLLKDIPILGYLFKNKLKSDNRTELLIFLTPTILESKGQGKDKTT